MAVQEESGSALPVDIFREYITRLCDLLSYNILGIGNMEQRQM